MIQQRIGDLLEIEFDANFYYVVVLTKIVMFGGNIVFAYHSSGKKHDLNDLLDSRKGFNVCTDLRLPKREGRVVRLHHYEDVSTFLLTPYAKRSFAHRPGEKAKEWFISRIDNLVEDFARVKELTPEYRAAMDCRCSSFDLVAKKILRGYTPDQNEHI